MIISVQCFCKGRICGVLYIVGLPFNILTLTLSIRFFRPRSKQYRARKQAAVSSVSRLLTRAVLYLHPNRGIFMKIHEYQGKELLRRFDVKVPRSRVARSVAEAEEAAKELGLPVVVKAQIHAGGRGKGGGVKLARTMEDVHNLAKQMIGMNLVTHQTGPEGRGVHTLLIEEGLRIRQEFYLGLLLDRAVSKLVFMASAAGGMDIEEVAAKTPEKILKEYISPA